jgi:integrase
VKAGHIIRSIRSAVAGEVVDSVSFEGVANLWFERHVVKSGLRSEHKQKLFLRKHIIPAFAGMAFTDVRRKHITALLDQLEDKNGKRQADYGLAILSGICSWYAKRDEDYNSPIIKGMKRQGDNRRKRILNDAELALVWKNAEGMFGNLVKFALLTGQRKDKYLTMRWDDVRDGVWNIRSEEREKGHGGQLSLPLMALAILEDQRRINSASPFVFAGPVGKPLSQIGRRKEKLDAVVKIPHWTIHDLRRTSRSLMAAAGVPDLIAELVLGHVQKGVAGIYNRHEYRDEKAEALQRLAAQIRDIVTPPPSNVKRLRA